MDVLLSIKPEHVNNIFNGKKKYEYRKAIFNWKNIEKVIVYASHPEKQVIGEFEIEYVFHEKINELWLKTKDEAGISEEQFQKYFSTKSKGYAIKIIRAKKYPSPKPLNHLTVSSPPQSFMYLNTQVLNLSNI
jgi:predicted transcriptional regulator